jgi:hypothetical protein
MVFLKFLFSWVITMFYLLPLFVTIVNIAVNFFHSPTFSPASFLKLAWTRHLKVLILQTLNI